jgi:hypothetical protein
MSPRGPYENMKTRKRWPHGAARAGATGRGVRPPEPFVLSWSRASVINRAAIGRRIGRAPAGGRPPRLGVLSRKHESTKTRKGEGAIGGMDGRRRPPARHSPPASCGWREDGRARAEPPFRCFFRVFVLSCFRD